jgi:hypothetical protein
MSTRGIIGFVIDGDEKLTYNHSDSYPSWLGVQTLKWLRDANLADVYAKARALRMVDDAPGVNPNSDQSYYWKLRDLQGDWQATLDAGLMHAGGSDFALDSLFCEWGYVIDLDRPSLEVYRGFQRAPHTDGRFADRNPEGEPSVSGSTYYPVRLVARWGLEELPTEDEFLAVLESDD